MNRQSLRYYSDVLQPMFSLPNCSLDLLTQINPSLDTFNNIIRSLDDIQNAHDTRDDVIGRLYRIDPRQIPAMTPEEIRITLLSNALVAPRHSSSPQTYDFFFVAQNFLLSFFTIHELRTTLRTHISRRATGHSWQLLDDKLLL